VTVRKFVMRAQSLLQLVELGALTTAAAEFLDAAVQAGVNILVSGPTGSGKTTLLNALGASIVGIDERVVTVEEVPELVLDRRLPDCVALQVRGKNVEGLGEITIRDLVRNALRMRPTRIIVGEVRGAEALDMLLAMNTGHDGSLTTIHGNSPRDALDRLATLAMMAGERLAGDELVRMVSRTIELVVQLRVTARTGRLIGIIWPLGSVTERRSEPALRAAPMSLRSGATREPCAPTRWQRPHSPLPSNVVRPRRASPGFTDPRSNEFMLRR